MSDYTFFFSYSRDDFSPFMKQFLEDLREAVRLRMGYGQKDEFVFLDNGEITIGEDWKPELLDGLQSSRILLCMYTVRFFRREWCGREIEFFRLRQKALAGTKQEHPSIIPVIWFVDESEIPASVSQITFKDDTFPQEYADRGMLQLTQQKEGKYQGQYWQSVNALADAIKTSAAQPVQLPALTDPPILEALPSAFRPPAAPAGQPAPGAKDPEPVAGPSAVLFYYAAGKFQELQNANKVTLGFYDPKGGEFWRPSLKGQRLGALASAIAGSKELDLVAYNLPITGDLVDKLKAARKNNNLVIFFVDAWTLDVIEYYRERMSDYEDHVSHNASVLVIWNEGDPDLTDDVRKKLNARIKATFPVSYSREQIYFRPSIENVRDLEECLRDTLERIRNKIIEQGEVARALETGSKPGLELRNGN